MTDTTTITDTTQEVTEATQQAVKQVNQITQYLQDSIPGLITFGLEVLAALVAFFIGRLVIKWSWKESMFRTLSRVKNCAIAPIFTVTEFNHQG